MAGYLTGVVRSGVRLLKKTDFAFAESVFFVTLRRHQVSASFKREWGENPRQSRCCMFPVHRSAKSCGYSLLTGIDTGTHGFFRFRIRKNVERSLRLRLREGVRNRNGMSQNTCLFCRAESLPSRRCVPSAWNAFPTVFCVQHLFGMPPRIEVASNSRSGVRYQVLNRIPQDAAGIMLHKTQTDTLADGISRNGRVPSALCLC